MESYNEKAFESWEVVMVYELELLKLDSKTVKDKTNYVKQR